MPLSAAVSAPAAPELLVSQWFNTGDAPTLADCCLIPQWANALRMGCDLSGYPRCKAVYDACTQLPAFIAAAPENQQDKIPA